MADIRIEQGKVRIYSAADRKHCEDIANETRAFFHTLKELRDVMSRMTRQAEAAKQGIDEEKKAVVGIRNIREIEYEDGEAKKLEMKDEIEGKKSELDGLQKEHDSLKNMLQSQRSKMDKISLNSS